MNEALKNIICDLIDDDSLSISARPVGGGDTHQAFLIETQQEKLFAKVNTRSQESVLHSEYRSLNYLQETAVAGLYPSPIGFGSHDDACVLLMQALELRPIQDRDSIEAAGSLYQHHQCNAEEFGWHDNNFIGASVQNNTWHADWAIFFLERRLLPQLHQMNTNGANKRLLNAVESQFAKIETTLQTREIKPSLVHGDMWTFNIAWNAAADSLALYDPAPYYGDPLADIAMSRLFGHLPQPFYEAYFEASSSSPAQLDTIESIYNLYHAMNHYNLFGSTYETMILLFCERILKVGL